MTTLTSPLTNDPNSFPPERQAVQRETLSSEEKGRIKALHQQWGSPFVRQQLNNIASFTCVGLAIYTWKLGMWPLTVVIWIVAGHFFHTKPLSLHDASHGTLSPNRRKNALFGTFCGTVSMVPLSVYRFAHAYHHGFMASERDPELWPFNVPGTSRGFRVMCAFLEIVFGFLYTPWLFLRSLFTCGRVKRDVRRRIILEYGLIVLFWGVSLSVIGYFQVWEQFVVGYLVPLIIAGMYQTLNKYTEHLGLLGDTVLSGTRTVIPRQRIHKTFSNLVQHVDHHGTHHRYAQIPFYHLPEASEIVYGDQNPRNPVFSTYRAAFFDMLPCLLDPKVGAQWIAWEQAQAAPAGQSVSASPTETVAEITTPPAPSI